MSFDAYQIDGVGAQNAATALGSIRTGTEWIASTVRGFDQQGADLSEASAPAALLLDEISQELGLLSDLFRIRAQLATLADRLDGGDPTAMAELESLFGTTAAQLDRSIDDAVGTDAVDFEPTDTWTPEQVAQWWASLSVEEQGQLQEFAPAAVGNTDGIPFDTRIETNGVRIEQWFDDNPNDRRIDQFAIPGTDILDPNRKFVFFDPIGDGMAAELFGNLDTATSVAVLVPGMGSELGNFSKVSGNARSLYDNDPSIAVIAWSGYDAPKGLTSPTSTEGAITNVRAVWEVAREDLAEAGGASLTRFRDGLALESDVPLTVIGHSYGSLVTGHAVQQGLTADRVVFIGSPGVGVDHVGEFPDGAVDEYFAARVHGDPVAELKRFGDDPTDPDFGAHVFDAGEPDGVALSLHSEYFDRGTAIDNLTTIVNGGDPTDDRPTFTNYITEPYSDLDIPFFPLDDIPTGWIDTGGAHVEDAISDSVEVVEEKVDEFKSEWDRWSNPANWVPDF